MWSSYGSWGARPPGSGSPTSTFSKAEPNRGSCSRLDASDEPAPDVVREALEGDRDELERLAAFNTVPKRLAYAPDAILQHPGRLVGLMAVATVAGEPVEVGHERLSVGGKDPDVVVGEGVAVDLAVDGGLALGIPSKQLAPAVGFEPTTK